MKKTITLDPRLSLAASFVEGKVCADIGTDHAYIPVYLLTSGKCDYAIASDINEGPLNKAKENAALYNVSDKVYFALTDGLRNLPLEEKSVTDIVICGMGGELIASIIDACPYTRNKNVRLILQPMSSIEELREYLDENGFNTVKESICVSAGKIYQCICTVYDGEIRNSSPAELSLGKLNIQNGAGNIHFNDLLDKLIAQTQKKIDGKKKGSADFSADASLLEELLKIRG